MGEQLGQMMADPVIRVIGAMIVGVVVLGTYVTRKTKKS